MTNASVVVCMDASGSMSQRGYFQPAQTDAATFVNIMQTGDSLGVTGFSNNAWISYPSSSGSVGVISSQNDQNTATAAIMAMRTIDMTNMSAGLATSAGMLTNGQVQTLQQIASGTGGTFHLSPTPFDLADIYNEIIGQTNVANVVANNKRSVNQNTFWVLPGTVAQGTSEATFSVSWTNWAVSYTSGMPVGNQVNVTLQDPSGGPASATPTAVGNGFVVFKVQNPASGIWKAAIWSSASGTLGTSGGIFDPQLTAKLQVEAPMSAQVGNPVALSARVVDADGSPVSNVSVSATLEAPSMDPDQAVKNHRSRLDALPRSKESKEESDNVRMLALQMQVGPGELLLPYEQAPLFGEATGNGDRRFAFTPKHKGGHIVRLEASGHSAKSNRDFSLTRRISVWADRK
jgi:hypothetical protein